ncbi:antibiotic biosynthesis monooxygenase family protein [Alteromonas sp. C1M14]|uniref:putative quinol monooxygenase n=1 Tax=Alteromonas sp. C1M14 TaxID=2841567 RepID=UPI001C093851|nr:antibiotic biosynthesis monooxygenase family protein [Alteromonas sp. C1M14]MBU2978775.1 antibiotic biosynthesis monooxygenase [Alteromonas sp. C1M14]
MSVTRINKFKSADGKEAELFDFLKSLTPYITSSEGNLSYEVLQNSEDQSDFVIIEKWESIQSHKNSVESFPKEQMQSAMSLFGGAPTGSYYSNS